MDHDEVRALEAACQQAIAMALAEHWPHRVDPHVCHLMSKAAVTVLEATRPPRKHDPPPKR